MNTMIKRSLSLVLALVLCLGLASGISLDTQAAEKKPTVANWGTRGQTATSLSGYAEGFYTGAYTFENLIEHAGSKYQNEVPKSDLYLTLQSFMASRHTYQTNYDELRYDVYNYTDCENGNTGSISCFYSAAAIGPKWDSGKTWNREHTWPQSKGSNKSTPAGSDIMAVRPTATSANGSRGNTAYGESSGFYHPNTGTSYDLRGDCARIVLYTYVRWGTTNHLNNMWGKGGVIESQNILLKWMEEDPVDTWELGRNDAIQSYTGTRNVFVDYPELAFLLLGREVPTTMTTPSGKAASGVTGGGGNEGSGSQGGTTVTPPAPSCKHANTEVKNVVAATCTLEGYSGDTYCTDCGGKTASGEKTPVISHALTAVAEVPNGCEKSGTKAHFVCQDCNKLFADEAGTTPVEEKELVIEAGHKLEKVEALAPTETTEGHIAHYRCTVCKKRYADEKATDRLLENHIKLDKVTGVVDPEPPEEDNSTVTTAAVVLLLISGSGTAVAVSKKKKNVEP